MIEFCLLLAVPRRFVGNVTQRWYLFPEPKACGRPEQPPNSTMTTESFDVGATVEYACDEGHLLVGPTVRTCMDTGFYDEFPPVCKSEFVVRKC